MEWLVTFNFHIYRDNEDQICAVSHVQNDWSAAIIEAMHELICNQLRQSVNDMRLAQIFALTRMFWMPGCFAYLFGHSEYKTFFFLS